MPLGSEVKGQRNMDVLLKKSPKGHLGHMPEQKISYSPCFSVFDNVSVIKMHTLLYLISTRSKEIINAKHCYG